MEITTYQKIEQIIRVLQMRDETNETTVNGMRITTSTVPKEQRMILIDELVKLLTAE